MCQLHTLHMHNVCDRRRSLRIWWGGILQLAASLCPTIRSSFFPAMHRNINTFIFICTQTFVDYVQIITIMKRERRVTRADVKVISRQKGGRRQPWLNVCWRKNVREQPSWSCIEWRNYTTTQLHNKESVLVDRDIYCKYPLMSDVYKNRNNC